MNLKCHLLLLVVAALFSSSLAIGQQGENPRRQRIHDNTNSPDDGRVYDSSRHDYHPWNDAEDRAYRKYLTENHKAYRQFERNSSKEQARYWNWRHAHPDHKDRADTHR